MSRETPATSRTLSSTARPVSLAAAIPAVIMVVTKPAVWGKHTWTATRAAFAREAVSTFSRMDERWSPTRARIDASYTWLVIAAEREVGAVAARRGHRGRASPLVAADALGAEFHCSLGAVTAAAFAVEALQLEVIDRLRRVPGRDERWQVPAVQELQRTRGGRREPAWQRVLLTLRHDSILDGSGHWEEDLAWLFEQRNDVVHFDTAWEPLNPDGALLNAFRMYCAESATRAVDIAFGVLESSGATLLTAVAEHRPNTEWLDRMYPLPAE